MKIALKFLISCVTKIGTDEVDSKLSNDQNEEDNNGNVNH